MELKMNEMLLTNTLSTPMVYFNSCEVSEQNQLTNELKEHFNVGVTCLKNKTIIEAIQSFTKVIESDKTCIPAINNLGALYYSLGRISESIHFFEQAITKSPKNFQARYNLGTLYCLNKGFDLAQNQLLQAKAIVPQDPAINNNLALTYLSTNNRAEAALLFENIMQNHKNFDLAFHNYAHLLCQERKYEEAEKYYKQALEKNGNSALTLNDLACCYYQNNDLEKALALLYQITEATKFQFQPAIYNLGYIVMKKKLLPFEEYQK